MLVKDFKITEGNKYDPRFIRALPSVCLSNYCNAPTSMTEALTQVSCTNPRCHDKLVKRTLAILNMLGVKGIGPSKVSSFLRDWGLTNPLYIFAYEPSDGVMSKDINLALSTQIYNGLNSKKSFTLAEYIRIANLPYIQSSAFSIFNSFDDLDEAFAPILDGGVNYIRECLNIQKGTPKTNLLSSDIDGIEIEPEDISIRALRVYESLMTFKDELFEAIQNVHIIKINSGTVKIIKAVCSTSVGNGYATKADFYASVNSMYPDIHVEFGSAVTQKDPPQYVIWSEAHLPIEKTSPTNKVKNALKYNKSIQGINATPIQIIDAQDFLDILDEIS